MRRSLVALAVLCGCGDNITGTPLDELDAEVSAARCDRLVRCGLFADTATCAGFFRFQPAVDLEAAVAQNIVRYDGALAKQCHEAFAAETCDDSSREARVLPLACRQMFVGTRPADDACAFDEECASGICDIASCVDTCCAGTCHYIHPLATIDDACDIDRDCVADTYCGKDNLCHALVGAGGLCQRDVECDYRLGCIGPTELMPGNCREMPLVGESCPYQRCAEIGALCTASHMCIAAGLVGAPCTTSADCSQFASCDVGSGTCQDLPTLGMPCTSKCAGEAWCDTTAGTCVAPRATGEPCDFGDQCTSQFCKGGVVFDFCAELPLCF
jgi:hypothetical protein